MLNLKHVSMNGSFGGYLVTVILKSQFLEMTMYEANKIYPSHPVTWVNPRWGKSRPRPQLSYLQASRGLAVGGKELFVQPKLPQIGCNFNLTQDSVHHILVFNSFKMPCSGTFNECFDQ